MSCQEAVEEVLLVLGAVREVRWGGKEGKRSQVQQLALFPQRSQLGVAGSRCAERTKTY
jgi:hypothetical protein